MTTLAELRTRARSRADMPGTNFITNAEIDVWINEGIQRIHDKLVEAYAGDYMESKSDFTTDGTAGITLPADFYKLLGVDLQWHGQLRTLKPYQLNERNIVNRTDMQAAVPRYKLSGGFRLYIYPTQPNNTSGTVWYVPSAQRLTVDADYVLFPNGWEKYAIVYAAVQMLTKEESETSALRQLLLEWDTELSQAAENRNSGIQKTAVDTDLDNWYFVDF